MTKDLALPFDDNQIELLKNTVCKGSTNDELSLFLHVCKHTGLDPFMKQIYSIARGGQRTIQTSIDGLRLIAERTGKYCPGREPTFIYNQQKGLIAATSYVKKQTKDGIWHEISSTAYFEEYNAGNSMWKKMPHCMLAKCAEAAALRRAFPAEMAGLYSEDEMQQADKNTISISPEKPKDTLSQEMSTELRNMLGECDPEYVPSFFRKIKNAFKSERLEDIPVDSFQTVKNCLIARRDEYFSKQQKEFEEQQQLEHIEEEA